MIYIDISQGYKAAIDDADLEIVSAHKWSVHKIKNSIGLKYAQTNIKTAGVYRPLLLHHFIVGKPSPGMVVDHIDGDGLNNTRANLRFVTQSQNIMNAGKSRAGKTSQYKGVSWHKGNRSWDCRISINGKQRSIGMFKLEIDAARAYDAAARLHHGDKARTNFQAIGYR